MSASPSINFLRDQVRIQEEVLTSDRRIATYTSFGLIAFLVVMFGTFAYRLFLDSQIGKIDDAIVTQKQVLASYAPVQTNYFALKDRIETIQQVLDKRTGKWDAITYFYSIIPPESTIRSISLSAADNSLIISYRSPSIQAFRDLTAVLQSESVLQRGYTQEYGGVTRAKNGFYETAVTVKLQTPKKVAK